MADNEQAEVAAAQTTEAGIAVAADATETAAEAAATAAEATSGEDRERWTRYETTLETISGNLTKLLARLPEPTAAPSSPAPAATPSNELTVTAPASEEPTGDSSPEGTPPSAPGAKKGRKRKVSLLRRKT